MTRQSFQRQLLGLAGWLAASCVAGGIATVACANAGAFYRSPSQPSWAAPAWLFGPVWPVLYILGGSSLVPQPRGFGTK
jgi:tryptophan-rich sensory protein